MYNFRCPLRGFHIEISLPRTAIQSFFIGVDLQGDIYGNCLGFYAEIEMSNGAWPALEGVLFKL